MKMYAAISEQRGGQTNRTKLFLIDDHPIVEAGLRLVLKGHPDLCIFGSCLNPDNLLVDEIRDSIDIFVLDLVYSGNLRIDAIRTIRQHAPASIIVVYSSLPRRQFRPVVIAAGANEFVSKDSSLGDLISIVRKTHERIRSLDSSGERFEQDGAEPEPGDFPSTMVFGDVHLTHRERSIARLLGQGMSVAQIGVRFGISRKTVSVHRDNIRRKLNCRDSNELIARLSALGPGTNDIPADRGL